MDITLKNDEKIIYSHDMCRKGFLGLGKSERHLTITDRRIVFSKAGKDGVQSQEIALRDVKSVDGQYRDHLNWCSIVGIVLGTALTIFGILSANNAVLFTIGAVGGPLLYYISLKHLESSPYELEFDLRSNGATNANEQQKPARYAVDDQTAKSVVAEITEVLAARK